MVHEREIYLSRFSQTLQRIITMVVSVVAPCRRAKWVLNGPEPPSLCHELVYSMRETVLSQGNIFTALKNQLRPKRLVLAMQLAFPIWSQNYNITKFKADFIAGLTLVSLSIPHCIGYALMEKLEPQYGLYTSAVPPLIYAALGTSRDIVIGPVAVDSMLLSSTIQKLIDPRTALEAYKRLVFLSLYILPIFHCHPDFTWLGFLVDFLSHAAIVGFMAGAAIIIGLQQLKGLLGIANFTHNTDIISVMISVFRGLNHNQWHYPNLILGFSCLSFILTTRFLGSAISIDHRLNKKLFWLPVVAPLLSFILSTLIAYSIGVQVQEGLNPSSVRQLQFDGPYVGGVTKIGFIVAVVALTETMAIGRSFASLKGYHINANKEMVSLGFMNIIGSMTSFYIATGNNIIFEDHSRLDSARHKEPRKTSRKLIHFIPGVLIIRVKSAWLFFANSNSVREAIMGWVTENEEKEESKKLKKGIEQLDIVMLHVLSPFYN
ncbi:hypothetical protein RGQ29_021921 [Quercus rubra]|uniref:SLC26A/SulP transporter domain-containing protein n=1 Tax=Quercus rubra TaxID=3512 RepID=A0AAN7F2E1_QUERU|nr:hypothetical protein RGQ29_021921 [Quercus rubra]